MSDQNEDNPVKRLREIYYQRREEQRQKRAEDPEHQQWIEEMRQHAEATKNERIPYDPDLDEFDGEWLTSAEAAKYLRLSEGALRVMVHHGKVPYYKFARRNRYRRSELRDLIERERRGYGAVPIVHSFSSPRPRKRKKRSAEEPQ